MAGPFANNRATSRAGFPLQQVALNLDQQFRDITFVNVRDLVAEALKTGAQGLELQTIILRQLRQRGDRRALQRIHVDAGLKAHQSMLRSYRASGARRGKHGTYRNQDPFYPRFSGGILEAALADASIHVVATPDGVSFINSQYLDRVAPQWRRIAFGTNGAGESPEFKPQPLTYRGTVLAQIGGGTPPAREPHLIPVPVGRGGGGPSRRPGVPGRWNWRQDTIEPGSRAMTFRPATPVRGRNFFTAGHATFARELSLGYEAHFDPNAIKNTAASRVFQSAVRGASITVQAVLGR